MTKAVQGEGTWAVAYEAAVSAFIIRIFGTATEQDVGACFRRYHEAVEESCPHGQFNVILSIDAAAHSSIPVVKLMRTSIEDSPYRDRMATVVGVSEERCRGATAGVLYGDLRLFADEDQALRYLADGVR